MKGHKVTDLSVLQLETLKEQNSTLKQNATRELARCTFENQGDGRASGELEGQETLQFIEDEVRRWGGGVGGFIKRFVIKKHGIKNL